MRKVFSCNPLLVFFSIIAVDQLSKFYMVNFAREYVVFNPGVMLGFDPTGSLLFNGVLVVGFWVVFAWVFKSYAGLGSDGVGKGRGLVEGVKGVEEGSGVGERKGWMDVRSGECVNGRRSGFVGRLGYWFIVGGGVSNILDRLFYGGRVVDFITFQGLSVLNLADVVVGVGVILSISI